MAAIETIKDGADSEEIINVGTKVGKECPNAWSDVMVVQALLKYIREFGRNFAPHLPRLDRPTGFPESWLGDLIKSYQADTNTNPGNRFKLKVDGKIGRAKGTVGWGVGQKWTIVDINQQCKIVFLARRSRLADDYISDIRKVFPQVNAALGTLPLSFPF